MISIRTATRVNGWRYPNKLVLPETAGINKFAGCMQVLKEQLSAGILKEASTLFYEHSFLGTSMREVAKGCGIAVGNIYNYYQNKDELFQMATLPAVEALRQILKEIDDTSAGAIQKFTSEESISIWAAKLSSMLIKNDKAFTMLLLRANGSSLENFLEDSSDMVVKSLHSLLERIHALRPSIAMTFSDEKLRLSLVRLFAIFEHVLKTHADEQEAKRIIALSLQFELSAFRTVAAN